MVFLQAYKANLPSDGVEEEKQPFDNENEGGYFEVTSPIEDMEINVVDEDDRFLQQ
jgi:hypothetical protein